jgi:uncharacterized membrane protein YgcG
MEWLLVLLLAAGAVWLIARSSKRRREAAEQAEAMAAVRRVAQEDVTRLGEDLQSLDAEVAGRQLDEATRQDYRRALDAYDAAKSALEAARRPDDIRGVTGALEDGRYAIATVQARLSGAPLPVRRPPCFFNPQHGPSTTDVEWAPPGGVPRQVPACAADAERIQAGAEPDTRKVLVGSQRRDYWEAGPAYGPWAQGYFSPYAGSGLLPGVLLGAVLTGGFGGGWDGDGSYSDGYQAGLDAGDSSGDGGDGGDGGSADGGDSGDGGDLGGGGDFGDFGGGDFGGGDF